MKEKDIVSKLFAVATRALETFQKEVATFIEDDEQSMLTEAEEYLRQKEERRAKLSQCKQNLEQVSSTDALCFLQVSWNHARRGAREREELNISTTWGPNLSPIRFT